MIEINLDNWKKYKGSEANLLFKPEQLVMYEHGFTRYSEKVGKVERVTPAGVVYVKELELKLVDKSENQKRSGGDWQMGGWSKYDPSKIVEVGEELLKFMPSFESYYSGYVFHDPEHPLIWKGNERSGLWHLRPMELDEKGLVKLTYDAFD